MQELRSANATFTNITQDAHLLNATTSPSWKFLYISPIVQLPNDTSNTVFFEVG